MSDYISRQAAIDAIEKHIDTFDAIDTNYLDGLRTAMNLLHELPSAQPEIIRCRDCKYAEYIDDVRTLWCTECGQGRTVAPNDFCSYGKR